MTPRTRNGTARRGTALLITLAAMVISITAATIMVRLAATARMSQDFDRATIEADELLAACEAPVLHWLANRSSHISLPPDAAAPAPATDVLHDRWTLDGVPHEVQITAYDQFGMVSLDAVRSGSPLRLSLPDAVLAVIDRLDIDDSVKLGLDIFRARHDPRVDPPIFPPQTNDPVLTYGAADQSAGSALNAAFQQSIPPAIGSLIATHGTNPPGINVNTAPIPLIEAALRAAGRGGLEQIIAARQEGRFTSIGSLPAEAMDVDSSKQPRLIASSTAWAFRIDIAVGPVRRAWWVIYVKSSSQWSCAQRLAIDA